MRKNFDLSVYVIIDPSVCAGRSVEDITYAVLEGGATFLQLRNKIDPLAVVEYQAQQIANILANSYSYSDVAFVLDDYVELAVALDLDGVHVGQEDMAAQEARALIGEDKILGLTAFTPEHYAKVDPKIVDYIGTGPVYPTLTKPEKDVLGIEGFKNLVRTAPVPVVGIGGVTPDNAAAVIRAGAHGVSMIRAVVGADDPKKATQDFVNIVKDARG
ncbi:MAG: thiamine phosphate synthase [Alphaproteobacteria bacterium]|nr:thiamine phosphate synthase [Alphaproteobacteria bacterium]